jgi:hypothetical protein
LSTFTLHPAIPATESRQAIVPPASPPILNIAFRFEFRANWPVEFRAK